MGWTFRRPPNLLWYEHMNTSGLLDSINLYNDIQDLRELGLTQEEIDGYIEFEWDGVGVVIQIPKQDKYD